MSRESLLKGTLILTLAGFLTRIMGFFYKIYLSNVMAPESLGLYQLVFPVYGLMFTLYGAGVQTAISQLVANRKELRKDILSKGIMLSLSIAVTLSVFLYFNSGFIAEHFLMEKDCAGSLRTLSLVFPFCGITACIQGYYYGIKETRIPALSQFFEQLVRIVSVFVIASFLGKGDTHVTSELAVLGIVFGEIGANLLCIYSLRRQSISSDSKNQQSCAFRPLMALYLPLTGTKLIVSLLHSLEAVLLPYMLKAFGLSAVEALATYGILTGMCMPFLLFPSAITNAFSLLVLPTVAEAQAVNNTAQIKKTSELSVKYSLLLGLYSTCVFFLFGKGFGISFFHNEAAGTYMAILSFLCPFLYIQTTLNSIINGLGKPHITFLNTVTGLGIRILFLCFLVPKKGLYGYLLGFLVSQIFIAILDYFTLKYYIPMFFNSVDWILKPGIILLASGFMFQKIFLFLQEKSSLHQGILLLLLSGFLGICYLLLLYILKIVTGKDFKSSVTRQ